MTQTPANAVLDTVVRVAMDATGASRARLFSVAPSTTAMEDTVTLVVAHGGDVAWRAGSSGSPHSSLVGYVVATGQPQVLTSQDRTSSALCAPCIHDYEVVGALELGDKAGGGAFSMDDMEMTSLFAGIAGAAIVGRRVTAPLDPAHLVGRLGRLAATDPPRYATIARLVQRLLNA